METCGDCRYLDGTDCRRFPATAKKLPEVPACGEYRAKDVAQSDAANGYSMTTADLYAQDEARAAAEITISAVAAGVKLAQQWQPIETAPKDGTFIILHYRGDVFPGRYTARCGPNWETARGSSWSVATHWMPLPAPPTSEDQ